MPSEVDISALEKKLAGMQAKIDAMYDLLLQKSIAEQSFGDWIPQHLAEKLCGLKRSSLLALRKAGKLTSSTISGKGVFYRRSDFEKLLNENENELK